MWDKYEELLSRILETEKSSHWLDLLVCFEVNRVIEFFCSEEI